MAINRLFRWITFSYLLFFSLASVASDELEELVEDLEYEIEDLIEQIDERNKRFKINGFLSAGASYSDSTVPLESTDLLDEVNFSPEAVLGLQLEFKLNDKSKVVTQLVGRGKTDFDIVAEWGYFAYKVTPALTFRAGRLRIPLFLLSDYLEVGYAYPWVRPSAEVYDLAELFSSQDGMDILYNFSVGSVDTQLQLGGGTLARTSPSYGGLTFKATDMITMAALANYKSWTLNANVATVDFVADITGTLLGDADNTFTSNGAGEIKFDHLDILYYSVGAAFDNGVWMFQAEAIDTAYENRPGPQIFPIQRAHYISIARRFNRVTPYFLFAQNRTVSASDRREADAILAQAGVSPFDLARVFTQLLDHTQSSWALGINYSLSPKAKLKFEWKLIGSTKGTVGDFEDFAAFTSILGGQDALDGTNVYNLVFDVVF
ncbi:MAG: hypothetical protein COB04_04065 [Gammaproteobacteria bacterium]|nr:MAG: hypothetical protein COB04_04065 [Gammaproteobacteria bacterium]